MLIFILFGKLGPMPLHTFVILIWIIIKLIDMPIDWMFIIDFLLHEVFPLFIFILYLVEINIT